MKFRVEIRCEEAIPTQSRKKDHQESPHSMCQWMCQASLVVLVKPLHQRRLPSVLGCFSTAPWKCKWIRGWSISPRICRMEWLRIRAV